MRHALINMHPELFRGSRECVKGHLTSEVANERSGNGNGGGSSHRLNKSPFLATAFGGWPRHCHFEVIPLFYSGVKLVHRSRMMIGLHPPRSDKVWRLHRSTLAPRRETYLTEAKVQHCRNTDPIRVNTAIGNLSPLEWRT
jgi:hypothetical protein